MSATVAVWRVTELLRATESAEYYASVRGEGVDLARSEGAALGRAFRAAHALVDDGADAEEVREIWLVGLDLAQRRCRADVMRRRRKSRRARR